MSILLVAMPPVESKADDRNQREFDGSRKMGLGCGCRTWGAGSVSVASIGVCADTADLELHLATSRGGRLKGVSVEQMKEIMEGNTRTMWMMDEGR